MFEAENENEKELEWLRMLRGSKQFQRMHRDLWKKPNV